MSPSSSLLLFQQLCGILAPEDLPVNISNYQCEFDDPVLRSVDGAPVQELTCSSNSINGCPAGTMCIEPAGVCCTGASSKLLSSLALKELFAQAVVLKMYADSYGHRYFSLESTPH